MATRTCLALLASLTASCAVMSRGVLFGSDATYTPAQASLVQRSLDAHGYHLERTGAYDAPTRAAVTAFQRSRGLQATGDIDEATAHALGLRPSDVTPVRDEDWNQDDVQFHAWHDPAGP